jgi:hypothetical protein
VCVGVINRNWAPAVRPCRIGKRKWYDPKRQWCRLLQCIVMVAFLRKSPSTCIVLEKIAKKKMSTAWIKLKTWHYSTGDQIVIRSPIVDNHGYTERQSETPTYLPSQVIEIEQKSIRTYPHLMSPNHTYQAGFPNPELRCKQRNRPL